MCDCSGERPTIYREGRHKARKEYRCYECRRLIWPGERYLNCFGVWTGEAMTMRICGHCDTARQVVTKATGCTCWNFGQLNEDLLESARSHSMKKSVEKFGLYRLTLMYWRQWAQKPVLQESGTTKHSPRHKLKVPPRDALRVDLSKVTLTGVEMAA